MRRRRPSGARRSGAWRASWRGGATPRPRPRRGRSITQRRCRACWPPCSPTTLPWRRPPCAATLLPHLFSSPCSGPARTTSASAWGMGLGVGARGYIFTLPMLAPCVEVVGTGEQALGPVHRLAARQGQSQRRPLHSLSLKQMQAPRLKRQTIPCQRATLPRPAYLRREATTQLVSCLLGGTMLNVTPDQLQQMMQDKVASHVIEVGGEKERLWGEGLGGREYEHTLGALSPPLHEQ